MALRRGALETDFSFGFRSSFQPYSAMSYWVHRGGENFGPYSLDQLQGLLDEGQLTLADLAILEGDPAWKTVGDILDAAAFAPPAKLPVRPAVVAVRKAPADPAEEQVEDLEEPALAASGATTGGSRRKLWILLSVLLVLGGGAVAAWQLGWFGKPQEEVQNPTPNKPKGNSQLPNLPNTEENGTSPIPIPNPPTPGTGNPTLPTGADLPLVRPLPASAAYLPADAFAVLTIAPKQLLDKAGGFSALLDQAAGATPEGKQIKMVVGMFSPENLGFAINQPLHVFAMAPALKDAKPDMGLVLPVGDIEKINTALPNALTVLAGFAKVPAPNLKFADQGGFQACAVPGLPVVMGYNNEALVVLVANGGDTATDAATLMPRLKQLFGKAGGLTGDAHFKASQQKTHDFGIWLNLARISQVVPLDESQREALAQAGVSSVALAGWFGKGNVRVDVSASLAKPLTANPSGKGVPKELLDVVPANALVVLAASVNAAAVAQSLAAGTGTSATAAADQALAAVGLSVAKLLELAGGDAVVALLPPVQPGGAPAVLAVASVKSTAAADAWIKSLETLPAPGAGGLTLAQSLKLLGLQFFRNGNWLCLSPDSLKSRLETPNPGDTLPAATRSLLEGNAITLHASIKAALPLLREVPGAESFTAPLSQFESLTLAGNSDVAGSSGFLTLELADKKTNSLSLLVGELLRMQQWNSGATVPPRPPLPGDPPRRPSPVPQPPKPPLQLLPPAPAPAPPQSTTGELPGIPTPPTLPAPPKLPGPPEPPLPGDPSRRPSAVPAPAGSPEAKPGS